MAVNAIGMRRMILGEGSFVESLVGRGLILVLYTSLVGGVLTLLFVVNRQWAPVLLKYGILAATGLAAGFGARRLLIGRAFLLKLGMAIFALLIALGVMNVLSLGYVGVNLLRAYPSDPQWDGALQLGVSSALALLALRAWSVSVREVVVEPRYSPPPVSVPAPPPRRSRASSPSRPAARPARRPRRARARAAAPSLGAAFSAWTARVASQLSGLLPSPNTGTTNRRRRPAKKAARSRPTKRRLLGRGPAVNLSGAVEHVCPYCLEKVRQNDPRGIKICKVCKTWHHADCWAVTGVCQVPHQYVN